MAKVTDITHFVTFNDETWLSFAMSDDGSSVYLSDGCDTFEIPRVDLPDLCRLLIEWEAEHPKIKEA